MSENEQRRLFLSKLLVLGVAVGGFENISALTPIKLKDGQSIYKLEGTVFVDGKVATKSTKITPNSTVKTQKDSQIVFVVSDDAFILRENSTLKMSGSNILISSLRLLTGAILSVFSQRERTHEIKTPLASIGIRGTGLYVEADKEQTYVCTCYGIVDIQSNFEKNNNERIVSKAHDAPRIIGIDNKIISAEVKNHTNLELIILEELVGRVAPFEISGGDYN